MNILIGFAVAALKAGVSGIVENGIVQALVDQGINIGSDKIKQYLEKAQKELSQVLTDKSLREMDVPEDQTAYIRNEIKELLQSISLEEDLFRDCNYNAKSLAETLYKKYNGKKRGFVEYESEIQKVLYIMSEKAISLEKGRDGFIEDSLTYLMKNDNAQMEFLRKIWDVLDGSTKNSTIYLENEQKQDQNKRLPDRTEEYRRKWTENMFLNDFDEDEEDAGVNIPLHKLYQPLIYRLKGQKKDLSNLEERLNRCARGQDIKNRMLLILGQPGMGKSTMITWFLDWYPKKANVGKKEILVYRFTDLNIDWSFNFLGEKKRKERIDNAILKCLNMKKQDLNGKILILDGFDEVAVGNNRAEILNCLYNTWARDNHIKDFSLLVTCRENYIEELSQLSFPYIILQPWNEGQIGSFCKEYGKYAYGEQTELRISEEAIEKMKKMRNIFGIPLLLYMTLALEITVRDESSIVEVYDQIFDLEKGGLYDRCLKRKILLSYDGVHRIADIKKQIHQFSRKISIWMFENNPEQAAISKKEYEKIRDEIFEKNKGAEKLQKNDVLIGNYFRMIHCYDGVDTEKLTFVHRSIYEYFVVETIFSEIKEAVGEMTNEAQDRLAGVLGYRLKKGEIDYTIGQYLKAKVSKLIASYSEEKKSQFYIWLEGTVGKMLNAGMLYYTGNNIKEYRNVIGKEMKCFLNLLNVLRLFVVFSDRKYILMDVDPEQKVFYARCLADYANIKEEFVIDLSNVYLISANLRGVDFTGAKLTGADLEETNLAGAELRAVNLDEANLTDAELIGVKLIGAELIGSKLTGAKLMSADLSGSNLTEANLKKAKLTGADLREVNLTGAKLISADLSVAKLTGADFRNADLTGAKLMSVNLARTKLIGTKLIETDLREANLTGTKLIGTDLEKANLTGAKLIGTDLREVKLTGAKLISADLSGSKLTGADFRNADLTGAKLMSADLSGSKLIEAQLKETNLTGAKLIGTDLRGGKLIGAKLNGADLTGADLRGAKLTGADLRETNLELSRWIQEDVIQYLSLIKLAKFNMIYIYSKETSKRAELTYEELLSRYPE